MPIEYKNSGEVLLVGGEERQQLLTIARAAFLDGVNGQPLAPLHLDQLPPPLREKRASFVTLLAGMQLRGCVGSLEPVLPLAEDVRMQAVAAALHDYRFPPVRADELPGILISVSVLSCSASLAYTSPEDLLQKLNPHRDGVILRDGFRRATFLPQVWAKIPDPELFLAMLCQKMGSPPDLWRLKRLDVFTYQVEEIKENTVHKNGF